MWHLNLYGILREYFKTIPKIISCNISMEYLWNMQRRLHKIFRKIFTDYSDKIFYRIFLLTSRNISYMSSNRKFRKHFRNIPAEDFKRINN